MNSKKTSDKLAKQLSLVRNKRILKLKNKISAGKYKIDSLELAKALFMAR